MPELPEFEPTTAVIEKRGVGQNHYVRESFNRCIEGFSKMWHHHFEMLLLGYGAYVVFFQFCKKAFPEITDQTVTRMVTGMDVSMYRPDQELRRLARLAVEFGIDGKFSRGADRARQPQVDRANGRARPQLAGRTREVA